MLYTLSRSPYKVDLSNVFHLISKDDDLLLIQDGVIALLNESHFLEYQGLKNLFVLEEDLIARGLDFLITKKVKRIHYQDFVELTIKHKQHMAW